MLSIGSDIYKLLVLFATFAVYASSLDANLTCTNSSKNIDHDIKKDTLPTKPANLGANTINIPINNEAGDPPKDQIMVKKDNFQFATEGEASSNKGTIGDLEQPVNSNNTHSKGSIKGRKGAGQYPGATVAKKGVEDAHHNKSNQNLPAKESITIINEHPTVNTEQLPTTIISEVSQPVHIDKLPQSNGIHVKKPEVLSDDGDAGEFGNYSMLKPSTTGEDYVIIGIVIVIGIWFAVFGALIFYRRAGEYWDRRHYRRMDFLVEGMYND